MAITTLQEDQSGTHAMRQVAHHYVRKGRKLLAASLPSDEAVHAARKAIMKSRTALRLLRPALTKARFREEDRELRSAAHVLNGLRDAHVLIEALAGIRQDYPALRDNAAAGRLAAQLDRQLAQERARLSAQRLKGACRCLRRCERRAQRLRVGRHGWSVLGPAVYRIYRRGRRVLPRAVNHAPDEALHEWRKQIKHLRYALKMLQPMEPGLLGALARQADAIAAQLGAAHDLALLKARALEKSSSAGGRQLVQLIERARMQRASAALMAGEQLFQASPRAFESALGRAWRRWRRRA